MKFYNRSSMIILGLFLMVIVHQNCAERGFQSEFYQSLSETSQLSSFQDHNSIRGGNLINGTTNPPPPSTSSPSMVIVDPANQPNKKPVLAVSLMSANQYYQSLLNLTGLTTESDALRTEWNLRRTTFSDQGDILAVNPPTFFAMLSLSGQICQDFVASRNSLGEATRALFAGVSFDQPLSRLNDQQYTQFVQRIWSRLLPSSPAPTPEILQEFVNFKRNFARNAQDSPELTRNLIISTCAALLGSLDTIYL